MTNLTAHAIPYDMKWECWCEYITLRQKALRQPLCPTMSYGCLFSPPLQNTPLYRAHFRRVYETDSGRFAAVSCRASSGDDLVPVPHMQLPCSLTWFRVNYVWWKDKNALNTQYQKQIAVWKVIFFATQLLLRSWVLPWTKVFSLPAPIW